MTSSRDVRRVRHEFLDGLAVMGFSLATSVSVAVVLVVVARLAGN